MKRKKPFLMIFICTIILFHSTGFPQSRSLDVIPEEKLLKAMHSISSQLLYEYVAELSSDRYEGRLTGTEGYNAARWVASHFQEWGVEPLGDGGTYFQEFDIPYTLIFEGCEVTLHIPFKDAVIKKHYRYEDEFIPGSTSGSGEVTAEVVYVGYGVTASELNYDDYGGVDVKGKIVLMEREVPVSQNVNADLFQKWRPYSFHQTKLLNAVEHGAKGMLYNYGPIANPNNAYVADFIYSHVGDSVVKDLFSGTGRTHEEVVKKIKEKLQPQSFSTRKIVTIKNVTEHNPEGRGSNVMGILKGSDPVLSEEVIIIGAHLDHLGRCYEIMPGANDNASGVAVLMGVAKELAESNLGFKRSVLFLCFGAEEQAVVGSEVYLESPKVPLDRTVCLMNLDGVGCGDRLHCLAGKNFPALWEFINRANVKYIHRIVESSHFHNLARPRLDAARFMWKGIPTVSFSSSGSRSYYHIAKDDVDTITPEILEDLAQLLFLTVLDIANQDSVDFRN
ncbi:MAG: M28 family peptidase [bacterium]